MAFTFRFEAALEVRKLEERKAQERESIVEALKQTVGKVFGVGGAAELLAMKPTTLVSRIKALGIPKN